MVQIGGCCTRILDGRWDGRRSGWAEGVGGGWWVCRRRSCRSGCRRGGVDGLVEGGCGGSGKRSGSGIECGSGMRESVGGLWGAVEGS